MSLKVPRVPVRPTCGGIKAFGGVQFDTIPFVVFKVLEMLDISDASTKLLLTTQVIQEITSPNPSLFDRAKLIFLIDAMNIEDEAFNALLLKTGTRVNLHSAHDTQPGYFLTWFKKKACSDGLSAAIALYFIVLNIFIASEGIGVLCKLRDFVHRGVIEAIACVLRKPRLHTRLSTGCVSRRSEYLVHLSVCGVSHVPETFDAVTITVPGSCGPPIRTTVSGVYVTPCGTHAVLLPLGGPLPVGSILEFVETVETPTFPVDDPTFSAYDFRQLAIAHRPKPVPWTAKTTFFTTF